MVSNVLVSDSTKFSSYQIVNGFPYESGFDRKVREEMKLRSEVRKEVSKNLVESKDVQKKFYDVGKKMRKFKVGELVMVTNHYKKKWVDDKRKGPYVVEKVLPLDNYLLYDRFTDHYSRWNIQYLVAYVPVDGEGREVALKEVEEGERGRVVNEFKREVVSPVKESLRNVVIRKIPLNLESPVKLRDKSSTVKVGYRIEVFWSEEFAGVGKQGYYPATVVGEAKGDDVEFGSHEVLYDDEEKKGRLEPVLEMLDGGVEQTDWRLI